MLPPRPTKPPPPRPPKPPPPPLPHSAQHHGLWRVSAPRLCGRTPLVFESAREHPLQGCDEAGVHFDQLLFAPRAELGISRVDAVIVDEEIIGDGESHGRAAWVGLLVLVKAPEAGNRRNAQRQRAVSGGRGQHVGLPVRPRGCKNRQPGKSAVLLVFCRP
jgi:hypothetical protein